MSYWTECIRWGITQYIFAIPAGLPNPPAEGDELRTQVSCFVGEEPPPSFGRFTFHPPPPSGDHAVHPVMFWSCLSNGIRYECQRFANEEVYAQPKTWTLTIKRLLEPSPSSASLSSAPTASTHASGLDPRAPTTSSSAVTPATAVSRQKTEPQLDSARQPPSSAPGQVQQLSPQLASAQSSACAAAPPPLQEPDRGGMDWVQYVDTLPSLGPGESYQAYGSELHRPTEGLVYRLTTVPRAQREALWQLLCAEAGLPCRINGKGTSVHVDEIMGPRIWLHINRPLSLPDGPARLALSPVSDSVWQPQAALGESSYVLNGFTIRFTSDQTGQQDEWVPRGRWLDEAWEAFLCALAQVLTIEGQANTAQSSSNASRHPRRRIVYTRSAGLSISGRWIYGVGVRLDDGGARFELEDSPDGESSMLKMPGDLWQHKLYGTFLIAQGNNSSTARVKLRIPPTGKPQDVILRITADLQRIKYAVRPREGRGAALPIGWREWKHLRPGDGEDVADEWVECYFVNLRRRSRGGKDEHLLRPYEVIFS